MANPESVQETWQVISELLLTRDAERLGSYLETLSGTDTALAISRLDPEQRKLLLGLLEPEEAADLLDDVAEDQAVRLIKEMPSARAAEILDEMPSDQQADLLGALEEDEAEAILRAMPLQEAADIRRLMVYPEDSAGGLMLSDYLAYRRDRLVSQVLSDLERHAEQYSDLDVQYSYVTDSDGVLVGVLPLRDLLFAGRSRSLDEVMIQPALSVQAATPLTGLRELFEDHAFLAVPVADGAGRLVGVVHRAALDEAYRKQTRKNLLRFAGIVGGEEVRSMPLALRSGRRLGWLSINIVLNILAASVIAMFQDTLQQVIVLAVFLPIISDMSGCSGGQAVAVSIRELTLGLVRPRELLRVLLKETSVGLINGLMLGLLLGGTALLWKGNPWLGLVVGLAMALNTLVSVSLGGVLPLVLKGLRLDPALVSTPLLTTFTDMCGFFLVLGLATLLLPHLI